MPMMNLIEIYDYELEQASLLTYPDFVIQKGVETAADVLQMKIGSNLSTHSPFFPSKMSCLQKNDSKKEQSINKRNNHIERTHQCQNSKIKDQNVIATTHQSITTGETLKEY